MKKNVFRILFPLAAAGIALTSCGGGGNTKPSSKDTSEESTIEKTSWDLYEDAKKSTAQADPFGFKVAGARGSMAFETGKETEEDWSVTSINVEYLDMNGAFANLENGDETSEGSLSITDSKILISSDKIPEEYSKLISKTGIHIDGDLYLDGGKIYIDASNVYLQLIATAIGTGVSAITGSDWEFPAHGYRELSDDDFVLLSTIDSFRKKQQGETDLLIGARQVAIDLGKEGEVFTLSQDKYENEVIKMNIESESLLKDIFMAEFDVLYDSAEEAAEKAESASIDLKDKETAKADFEDYLDDLLGAAEFDHLTQTVVFNEEGVLSQELDFSITSFDHDAMLRMAKESGDLLETLFENSEEETSREETEEERAYLFPTGEWSAKAKLNFQYGDDVTIKKLDDEVKERYEEIVLPEKEGE